MPLYVETPGVASYDYFVSFGGTVMGSLFAIGLFLFLLGIILVIVAPIGKHKNKRCSEQAEGTLIRVQERRNSKGVLASLKIYSYTVDGVEYQFKSTAINPNAGRVGDRCPIWYDPKKPQVALEYRYNTNWLFNILLIVGILMILSPFVMLVISAGMQAQ